MSRPRPTGLVPALLLAALVPGGGVAAQDAAAADPCDAAVSADPEWAWVAAISARPVRELTRRSLEGVGERALARAVQLLRRALAAPPVCPADAVGLAALSIAMQERIALREAREALADRVEADPADGVARLWLARAAAAAGSPDALQLARDAAAAGSDPAGASLTAARSAFEQGLDGVGATAYFQGLQAVGGGDALAGYLGDLGPLVRADEGAELEGLDADGQARWLARFWLTRAAESGVTPQERLAEHYRRVRRAYAEFCASCVLGGVASPVIPWGRVGMGLDERGLVFLLQGEPDVAVSTQGLELLPNASWAWERSGDRRAVHFAVVDPEVGWQIMEDPLALVNPVRDPLALDEETPDRAGVRSCVVDGCEGRYVGDFYRFLADREAIDPRFRLLANQYRSRPADWGENAVSGMIVGGPLSGQPSFRFEAEEDLAEIRSRDVFAPGRWALADLALRAVAFRDADGAVASWLAVGGTLPDSAPAVARVDATLRDPAGETVVRGRATAAAGPGDGWVVPLEGARRGTAAAAVVLREGPGDTDAVVASGSAPVSVDPPAADGLALSDVVVWAGDEGTVDRSRADALARLEALPSLAPGSPAAVYLEVYGLAADQVFETRIRIERAEGGGVFRRLRDLFGGDDPSELVFRSETREPDDVRERTLSLTLPDLEPGRYRLEVEVRNRLRQAVRAVEFVVVDDGL